MLPQVYYAEGFAEIIKFSLFLQNQTSTLLERADEDIDDNPIKTLLATVTSYL
jgi:hypothetical protein